MKPKLISPLRRIAAGLFLAAALVGTAAAADKKPNVLLIMADDLGIDLGCYGHPIVKSPHLDQLAKQGVRFERAYCNYALCNPSRTSLLSGRRPETTGIMDNETPPRTFLGSNAVFLPEYFKKQGYYTARVGKIAHSSYENAISWDLAEDPKGKGQGKGKGKAALADEDEFSRTEGIKGSPVTWRATDNTDAEEQDGATARRIVQLLEQHKDGPFFIAAGFHKPHEPLIAPKNYFAMYPPDKIPDLKEPADDRADIPALSLVRNRPDPEVDAAARRRIVAGYYATISFMDAQVGYILDAVERLKLRDDTVIVFLGDHGWHLGEHQGLYRKTSLFEEADHAPLIISVPGYKPGQVSPRPVEFVSLFPTLVELCGLPKPEGLQGTSLVPLLKNPQAETKPVVTVLRWDGNLGKCVRTERWRYSEWNEGKDGAELYDRKNDPREYTNLAKDPKHADVVKEMKAVLKAETASVPYIPPAPGKKKKRAGAE